MMKDNLLKIINNYGVMHQLKYFQSEVFELNEAIIKYEDDCYYTYDIIALDEGRKHIAEEIADVLVMLKQFQAYYKINREDIRKIMNEKVDRQLGRMKNENIEQ